MWNLGKYVLIADQFWSWDVASIERIHFATLCSSALLWLDVTRFLSAVVWCVGWWLCCGRGSVETNKDYLRDQESVESVASHHRVTTGSKLSRGGLLIRRLPCFICVAVQCL